MPSFPLWPAPQIPRLSHSRVGWAFQEVPKKPKKTFGEFLVDPFAKNNKEREQRDTWPQTEEGALSVSTPGTCLG